MDHLLIDLLLSIKGPPNDKAIGRSFYFFQFITCFCFRKIDWQSHKKFYKLIGMMFGMLHSRRFLRFLSGYACSM